MLLFSRNAAAMLLCSITLLLTQHQAVAQGLFSLPALPYAYDALMPSIDSQTMTLHHDRHHAAYVNNLNNLIKLLPGMNKLQSEPLSSLMRLVGTSKLRLGPNDEATLRNQGGGAFNHAMFWRVMSAPGTPNTTLPNATDPNDVLAAAAVKAFGSVQSMIDKLTATANSHFGSGWAWLVAKKGKLMIMDTMNQDNPLMSYIKPVSDAKDRVPILCIDVWEHAYYLKYGPNRSTYVSAWWNVTNWYQVSQNYDAAINGQNFNRIIGPDANQRAI